MYKINSEDIELFVLKKDPLQTRKEMFFSCPKLKKPQGPLLFRKSKIPMHGIGHLKRKTALKKRNYTDLKKTSQYAQTVDTFLLTERNQQKSTSNFPAKQNNKLQKQVEENLKVFKRGCIHASFVCGDGHKTR